MKNIEGVTITQEGLSQSDVNAFTTPFAALAIYSIIIPVVILDLWAMAYQYVYFELRKIPKVSKREYVIFDRYKLEKLNLAQKVNCLYCEYVNGTLAWLKALANQTELYSCAIKHSVVKKEQEHQEEFYEYDEFTS